MNWIREYWKDIQQGRSVVSKKLKLQMEKLVYLLDHPEKNIIEELDDKLEKHIEQFEFREEYANKVIDFIEKFCHHVKGSGFAGKPIKLETWQKAIISALYGFVSTTTRYRRFRHLHLYVARKNGKTLLAACIIIYELLFGQEPGAECYSAATKRDQAKISWDMASAIIKKSKALYPSKFRITVNGIYLKPYSDSFFQPVSKESKKLDGLMPHVIHIDELHAIRDSNIIDVLWDGTISRKQPIEMITTTMGTERQNTFDEKYDYDSNVLYDIWQDDRLLAFIYELDDESEWRDIRNAYKANPNLGISHSIQTLHEEIEKAKNDEGRIVNLLTKHMNVRQTQRHAWLSHEIIHNQEEVDLKKFDNSIVIGGFDLSRTGDLTAFTTLLFDKEKDKIIAVTKYWCTKKWYDFVIRRLPVDKWVQKEHLTIAGDTLIDYHQIVQHVLENFNVHGWRYQFINYDRYSAEYLIQEFVSVGFSKDYVLIETAQGAKTLSIPMQEVEADLKDKRLIHQNNPITEWCMTNAEKEMDRNGNWMLVKSNYERKIDGVATILNAYVSYLQNKDFFMGG